MEHRTGNFAASGGTELYYQCWLPDGEPRAILAIVHGIGEHSGRYQNVVDHLVPRGYGVYGFDHRGHGRSPGPRGHVDAWGDFVEDVDAFLRLVAAQQPGRPLFLLGHSLGGLIVLDYVLHYPDTVQGVIASGPALAQTGASPLLMALARIMSRIAPRLTLDTGLDATAISRDPAVVEAYKQDPLVHGKATARFGAEMDAAMKRTSSRAAELRLPLLILHGGEDRLVPAEASRDFFERVTFADKERHEYEGGYHESHNDIEKERVLADLADWLERHSN